MPPYQLTPRVFFVEALANDRPKAMAWVVDNRNNPGTSGLVKFYQPSNGGILVEAEVFGLPQNRPGITSDFFAMHIHNAENCSNVMAGGGSGMMPGGTSTPIMPRNTGSSASTDSTSHMPSTGSSMMPGNTNSMMPGSGNSMMPGSGNSMGSGSMNNMMGHFNPGGMPHPFHAGDFPPLLSNQGYAWTAFFDRRFTLEEIIGKTVVIHAHADNFTSQPSGNSGNAIACGEIRRTN